MVHFALIAIVEREYFVSNCAAIFFNEQIHWPLNDLVLKMQSDSLLPVCIKETNLVLKLFLG